MGSMSGVVLYRVFRGTLIPQCALLEPIQLSSCAKMATEVPSSDAPPRVHLRYPRPLYRMRVRRFHPPKNAPDYCKVKSSLWIGREKWTRLATASVASGCLERFLHVALPATPSRKTMLAISYYLKIKIRDVRRLLVQTKSPIRLIEVRFPK